MALAIDLTGRVALVTGAARGLGRVDALTLARAGAAVVVADVADTGATVAEVGAAGGRALGVPCDVTDRGAVAEAVARAREALGSVDILVNNAAVLDHVAELERQDPGLWERDVRVNLTGAFNCAQAVWPGMRERGWGRIVNMSSITAELGSYAQASYATTKAALLGLTRTLALEGARHGITVNALLPGVTSTEAVAEASAAMRERWRKRTALRRLAEPQEVANVLAFLCSDLASYVTGAAVPVSGGMELLTLPD